MRVLNRGEIQMFAPPDEGLAGACRNACTRRQMAGRGAGLDIGCAFPCAAQTLVVPPSAAAIATQTGVTAGSGRNRRSVRNT